MESDRKAAPLRPTLRLSHPSKASEPKHGPRRSEAGTSSNSNVRRRAEEVAVDEAAKGAASAAAEALQSVAGRLKEPLDGGLTATQVLEDPQTRAAAARWRAGSGARQLTAVLARALQGLQAWARWPARETDQGQPAPVRPRPLRGSSRDHAPAEPTSWRAWLPSFSVRTVLLLICLFLFPRIIAKLTTLILRLLGRALASLVSNLIQELLSQTLQAATDMEDQVVEWLNHHLGGNSKPVVSLPQSEAVAPPPAQQPVVVSHPTRPVDLLMLLLLGLNLRQQQVGGGWGSQDLTLRCSSLAPLSFPREASLKVASGSSLKGPRRLKVMPFWPKKVSFCLRWLLLAEAYHQPLTSYQLDWRSSK